MAVHIHNIETLVPPYRYPQAFVRDQMKSFLPDRRTRLAIHGIYGRSGVDTRYSILPDFSPGADPVLFPRDDSGRLEEISTGPRNACYAEWAGTLAVGAAQRVLGDSSSFRPSDVTHLVTASCTGFCNPGPDLAIVRELGLSDRVERYHLGFMGCYAAFPALRMAQQFCAARPDSVVLVVCVELCTLHMQLRDEPDSILANALFADGAAAALVSARPPADHETSFSMHTLTSALAPEGAGHMAWSIGDRGFDIRLSSYVPQIIAGKISEVADRALENGPWGRADIGIWAVHPGGPAILDKVREGLGLLEEQIEDSRAVLREFGNMSSATILFVLQRILKQQAGRSGTPICAMAFGPGLTIESATLELIPAAVPRIDEEVSPDAIPH